MPIRLDLKKYSIIARYFQVSMGFRLVINVKKIVLQIKLLQTLNLH